MDDARIATSLPSHPKTKKLIKRLGGDAAWRLVCLFLWVANNKPDGDLSGMTDEDIELAVDWSGADGVLVAALVEVGFLEGDADERYLHDWQEHNPWAAGSERRSQVARENALKKWGLTGSENSKKRSQRLSEARKKATHTEEEWLAMKSVCGNACVNCGASGVDLSKDHITPICHGGSDGIDNIQPFCHRCNASKGGSDTSDLRPSNWSEKLSKRLRNACETPAENKQNLNGTSAPSPSPSPSPSLDSPNGESLSRKVRDVAPSGITLMEQAEDVMNYLNRKLRRAFRARAPNGKPTAPAKLIIDRLKEGYTVEDCKRVLKQKAGDWFEDDKMRQFLRPTTLYRANNFVTYLGECEEPEERVNGSH